MSKKKLDNKLIWLATAILGVIAGIVGLFLNVWNLFETSLGVTDVESYKLFANWPEEIADFYKTFDKTFSPIWATLFEVFAIVAFLAIIAVVVLVLLKKNKIAKIVAYVAAGLAVAVIICGCIFSISSHISDEIYSIKVVVDAKWAIGAWLLAVGSVVGAAGCVMATRK